MCTKPKTGWCLPHFRTVWTPKCACIWQGRYLLAHPYGDIFPYENKSGWWNGKIQKGNGVMYGEVTHTGGPGHDGSVVVALVDGLQLLQLSLLLDPAISLNPRSVFTPPQPQDSITPLLDICTIQWTLTSSAFVYHSTFRHLHKTVDFDIFSLCLFHISLADLCQRSGHCWACNKWTLLLYPTCQSQ